MGKVIAAGAALMAAACVLSACGRSDDRDDHETAAAPNMVEVAPEPANTVATPVVRSAATTVPTAPPATGDTQQIDEDAAAVGMTSRRTSSTTTTTVTTSTGPAQPAPANPPAAQ